MSSPSPPVKSNSLKFVIFIRSPRKPPLWPAPTELNELKIIFPFLIVGRGECPRISLFLFKRQSGLGGIMSSWRVLPLFFAVCFAWAQPPTQPQQQTPQQPQAFTVKGLIYLADGQVAHGVLVTLSGGEAGTYTTASNDKPGEAT